jgi:hypothetical protein
MLYEKAKEMAGHEDEKNVDDRSYNSCDELLDDLHYGVEDVEVYVLRGEERASFELRIFIDEVDFNGFVKGRDLVILNEQESVIHADFVCEPFCDHPHYAVVV